MPDNGVRHSQALEPELVTDPDEKARLEARNAVAQIDLVYRLVDEWLDPERAFRLRTSTILQLHRTALQGLSSYAGNWRPADIAIGESQHEPIPAYLVPEAVEELCDYINDNWASRSAVHLSAYALWRLNWIHPFTDGNGRTSRALSYFILCLKTGTRLPGTNTIPDQIVSHRSLYYRALEAADAAVRESNIDVSEIETIVESMLSRQLLSVLEDATSTEAAEDH